MPTAINFSKEYVEMLQKLLKVSKGAKKETLLFYRDEKDDMPKISLMDLGALVHISTTKQHANFDIEEFGVTKLSEFMDYVSALEYPKHGEIYLNDEVSTKGRNYSCVVLADDYTKYRMIVAEATEFEARKDKKVPIARDIDPMQLVAKFMVTQDDLTKLTNDIKLMKGCEFFGLTVNNDVSYYMRGTERQQVTRKVDGLKTKIYNSEILASDGIEKFRLFPARLFSFMSYFKTDFEVEIRYMESKDIVGFKAFGKLTTAGKDDIDVYLGATESTSQTMNNYDIIE